MWCRAVGIIALALALGFLCAPLSAETQQPTKVHRIGYLGNVPPTAPDAERVINAFRQGLRDLGYVEGQNLVIEWRFAEGKHERYPALAADLVRLKVALIVAGVTPAAVAAKDAAGTTPIVMISAADPVALGLVASLPRPGGNVTGLSGVLLDLSAKQLQLLKEAVPRVTRVAVLWNPGNPAHPPVLKETEAAARTLRVQLQVVEARGPDAFAGAFAAITREHAGALLVLSDPMFFFHREQLAELAAKNRLPSMYAYREAVDAGGLMSYAASLADLFRRAATYVDKILKGAKPADLPVEQPTKFELVVNLKTAKALGLTIPQSVLIRADEVIQ